MGRLEQKIALVTGGSRGIGRSIVEAFTREGATVIASASSDASFGDLSTRSGVHCIAANLASSDETMKLFSDALSITGEIDILVNNAGIYLAKPFEEYSLTDMESLMRVNVYAPFQLTQLAVTHMTTRGSGKIIQMSSTAGKWESPNQSIYNTTKHAMVGMSKCVALETAKRGVQVNTICPGMVDTDMFQAFEPHAKMAGITLDELKASAMDRIPQGRFLQPEEIANLAIYLASAESDGMTGQTITLSGGMRMS
jgi:meso-butanediol dehydrogenase/(S,S)-butanediol dehydrogenase/diacetyl reductase